MSEINAIIENIKFTHKVNIKLQNELNSLKNNFFDSKVKNGNIPHFYAETPDGKCNYLNVYNNVNKIEYVLKKDFKDNPIILNRTDVANKKYVQMLEKHYNESSLKRKIDKLSL
tara:strand:- start:2385 stop:2726 length:342 start_codon:yes stop_codon:yes gene_type:complete